MDRRKLRLYSSKSEEAINRDLYFKQYLEQSNRLLPYNDIVSIVNEYERFVEEREISKCYRISTTISPLFTNVLFNNTVGNGSWETFSSMAFTNRELFDEPNFSYEESVDNYLEERDGWFGYIDPDIDNLTKCTYVDMVPKREHFEFTPINQVKNWDIGVFYPSSSAQTAGDITDGGLLCVEAINVRVSGRDVVGFYTPVKHNLVRGDRVRVTGLTTPSLDGEYTVSRTGLDNGDDKEYFFCIDIPSGTGLGFNTRMTRIYAGEPSSYYFRKFTKLSDDNDYEVYPTAFANTIYNDKNIQLTFNEDIDISNLTDNLDRPLSQLYIGFIKTPTFYSDINNNLFTEVKSGLDIPFIGGVKNKLNVPDIHRIHNGGTPNYPTSHNPLDTNVTINDNDFYVDVCEYNRFEVKETILGEVAHRFNTIDRENGGQISINSSMGNGPLLDLGERQEGYWYKPFHQLKIREFSSYIEQGDTSTAGIPDYAEDLGDGRYLWRDFLPLGSNDIKLETLDYPFLNGCHYLYGNICLPLRRQDPLNQYDLYYNSYPRDSFGVRTESDNFITKRGEDVC